MISARPLVRRFGDHTAVHDLSFEAATGELIGPNGAEKSTTLKMLTGLAEALDPVTSRTIRDLLASLSRQG